MSLRRSARLEWLWSFGPVAIWIAVIFYLSSGQGSSEHTSRFITPLLQWLFPGAAPDELAAYHKVVRKCAHIAVYAFLGFLAARAFFTSLPYSRKIVIAGVSMAILLMVASLDEWNQSFNAARSSTAFDVVYDAVGGLLGTWFYLLVYRPRFLSRDSPA